MGFVPGTPAPACEEGGHDVSEQPNEETGTARDEAREAGATSQEYGNLSIEDDAEGTVDPADLAGTGGPDDDAVDA
jgi:hypothetical protein